MKQEVDISVTGEQLQDNTNLSDEARVDISVTGEQLQDNTNLSDEARVDISAPSGKRDKRHFLMFGFLTLSISPT